MNMQTVQIFGMVWYKQEEYGAALSIMSDRAKLHTSYHLWKMDAETREKQYRREGKTVVRAFIDPETFPEWCRARGLNIDANARQQFAALVAKEIATGGHQGGSTH